MSFSPAGGVAPGKSFSVTGEVFSYNSDVSWPIEIIWDNDFEGPAIGTGTIPPGQSPVVRTVQATVAKDADIGFHTVRLCWDAGDGWFYQEARYRVLEPTPTPTRTPTPTPEPTETNTPVPPTAVIDSTTTPPTAAPPTSVPPTEAPPTEAPPTTAPATAVPPTSAAITNQTATVVATETATETVSPTATATPTPTRTPTPVTSPTPDSANDNRPLIFQSVPEVEDTAAGDVVVTNLGLAGGFLVLVFVTATVLNQTFSENQGEVEASLRHLMAPFRPVRAWFQDIVERQALLRDAGWLAFVLGLTVVVYGFLEPSFGFNGRSIVVVLSLLVSAGVITYLTEGFEALIARNSYQQLTGVRIFPVAVLIAVVSVVLSRVTGFLPGVIYGFVGTAVYLRPSTLDEEQTAKTVFFPAVLLLGLSVVCWLLITPLRDWSADSGSLLAAFFEGVAVAVFVGGLEGLFFNMLPIKFMDGQKILRWNRAAWLLLAGASTFLFWQVLLNDQRAYFSAIKETTTIVALILGGSCLVLTLATWLYFKLRAGQAEALPGGVD